MSINESSRLARQLRASWWDTWVLIREFAWLLLLFFIAVSGGGALYYRLNEPADYHPTPDRTISNEDAMAILGGTSDINVLAQENNSIGQE